MAARYSTYPPIPADEYYGALMQAYLDRLQVDLRRQLQQQSRSTQVEMIDMAARYSRYPPIPAEEYDSTLMQAYLDDQLQVHLGRQLQDQSQSLTQVEPNQAKNVHVQQISTTITTNDSASSTSFSDDELAFLKEHADNEADYSEEYPAITSLLVSVLAKLGIYLTDDEIDEYL